MSRDFILQKAKLRFRQSARDVAYQEREPETFNLVKLYQVKVCELLTENW